jgi:hypothetical protein
LGVCVSAVKNDKSESPQADRGVQRTLSAQE